MGDKRKSMKASEAMPVTEFRTRHFLTGDIRRSEGTV